MVVPWLLPGVCGEGSSFPFPYVVAGCARGGAHGGFRPVGRGSAEDGDLRVAPLQPGLVPGAIAAQRLVGDDAGVDWHYLWRTGGDGAAQHEEVDRVFLGQSSWICCARNFQLHTGWAEWRDVRHAGARDFYRWTVHAGGYLARTKAYIR